MRARLMIAAAFLFSAAAAASATSGCGSSSSTPAATTTGGGSACDPANLASCTIEQTVKSDCVALADYSKATVTTLRMSQLHLVEPASLADNVVVQTSVVDNALTIDLPACNLGTSDPTSTSGNFNWLMQFDLTKKTLKTGGAHPQLNPLDGYAFADEMIMEGTQPFHIQPVELAMTTMPDPTGGTKFAVTKGLDLTIPVYQDKQASTVILLPLHEARIATGTLSSDHNCIGELDLTNLIPENNCKLNEPYVSAGTIDGFITLAEADSVVVTMIQTTLCALLASELGAPSCSKTGGKIDFKGDWCSTTNTAGGCQDSVHLAADFAAAAVKLK